MCLRKINSIGSRSFRKKDTFYIYCSVCFFEQLMCEWIERKENIIGDKSWTNLNYSWWYMHRHTCSHTVVSMNSQFVKQFCYFISNYSMKHDVWKLNLLSLKSCKSGSWIQCFARCENKWIWMHFCIIRGEEKTLLKGFDIEIYIS